MFILILYLLLYVFGLHVWLAAEEKISGNLSPVQQDSQNPFMLLSMVPTVLPKVGQSRVPPLTAGLQFQVSGLRANRILQLTEFSRIWGI